MHMVSAHSTLSDPSDASALAEYLSLLDGNMKPVVGPGKSIRLGMDIYNYICSNCHGANGEGSPKSSAPRVAKQHYPYLRRQIENLGQLHRNVSTEGEDLVLRSLGAKGKEAVADYLSRQGPGTGSEANRRGKVFTPPAVPASGP
jgi:mono/diheme cytochrome c family protein